MTIMQVQMCKCSIKVLYSVNEITQQHFNLILDFISLLFKHLNNAIWTAFNYLYYYLMRASYLTNLVFIKFHQWCSYMYCSSITKE